MGDTKRRNLPNQFRRRLMILRYRRWGVALVAIAVFTSFGTGQQNKPATKKTGEPAPARRIESTPAKKEKLYPIGVFAGKVLEVDDDGKWFQMQVHGTSAELQFIPGNPASC